MPKKLRCDRCGLELSDRDDLDAAFEGMYAWQNAVRSRGGVARGVLPCKNYARCGGEIIEVTGWDEWRRKLLRR